MGRKGASLTCRSWLGTTGTGGHAPTSPLRGRGGSDTRTLRRTRATADALMHWEPGLLDPIRKPISGYVFLRRREHTVNPGRRCPRWRSRSRANSMPRRPRKRENQIDVVRVLSPPWGGGNSRQFFGRLRIDRRGRFGFVLSVCPLSSLSFSARLSRVQVPPCTWP